MNARNPLHFLVYFCLSDIYLSGRRIEDFFLKEMNVAFEEISTS